MKHYLTKLMKSEEGCTNEYVIILAIAVILIIGFINRK